MSFLSTIFILLFSLSIQLSVSAQDNSLKPGSALKNRISEERFLLINGIQQWVTIKGESSKPVILFLHGGPGSPMSPYSNSVLKEWEKDFVLVQWDQRGTGKTYGFNAPDELSPEYLKANPLTLQQMVNDGVELSEYLLKHLGKQKIILFGTSWGSALGVKMVSKRPDLYHAYIGHSQIVDPSDHLTLYNRVYKMAQDIKDTASISRLNTIGTPPYARARNVGQLLRIVKKYESANSTPPPDSWFVVAPAYNNPEDNQNRSDGDDYSFVNYTGDSAFGVQSISATINLMSDNVDFSVPVYLIQGSEDLLTPKESTKEYFNKIKSPKKEYYLLPRTAHGFNSAVMETLYKICKSVDAL